MISIRIGFIIDRIIESKCDDVLPVPIMERNAGFLNIYQFVVHTSTKPPVGHALARMIHIRST